MAKINTSGEMPQDFERPLIAEDAYEGVLDLEPEVKEVGNATYGKKKKILVRVILDRIEKTVELPLFLNPNVVKGSGKYSDSKLYTILEKAGILEEFKTYFKDGEVADEEVLKFCEKLKGRRARVMVKNVDGPNGKYSTVKDVIRFVDRAETIKMNDGAV